jgi:hypothetical protein
MQLCQTQSLKTGRVVETMTAVIDVKGMRISQVTSDFLSIVKGIAKIDQSQYPETLGRFFIINTPSVFPFVWRGVKAFLDPAVAAKIQAVILFFIRLFIYLFIIKMQFISNNNLISFQFSKCIRLFRRSPIGNQR